MLWLSRPGNKATWEPANAISPSLVADYEAGLVMQTSTETEDTYGHTSTTVLVKPVPSEPAAKKARREIVNIEDSGLVKLIIYMYLTKNTYTRVSMLIL